ncbi:DUF1963 domain-containing protein [Oceanicola sp. D3]|uniref:DUF1963 domain-containing protein n=1 Tax=Oceanicola sp. D3 TaxID=2587163 RepID=UPI00111D6FE8|nr:DUF1963 domain-containing protein [Oceanicola sp. D3]QDC08523.1 DUF1963 domain-containing protein [Oceanicola sp. D3]
MAEASLAELIAQHLTEPLAGLVSELAVPVVFLVATGAEPGLSRMGGAPLMADGLVWPRHEAAARAEEIGARGADPEWIARHIRADLPLPFVAQIDLTEVSAEGLPGHGRLLFFYDALAGPYDTGTSFGRVLWDEAPASEAKLRPTPEALIEADKAYVAQLSAPPEPFILTDEIRAALKETGLTDEEIEEVAAAPPPEPSPGPHVSPFLTPLVALEAEPGFALPQACGPDFMQRPALAALCAEDRTDAAWEAWEAYEAVRWEHQAGRPQIGGPALGEQDDPAWSAAYTELSGEMFVTPEWRDQSQRIDAEAREWQLLLQMPLSFWISEQNEGTVYFYVRRDDLAARRFERVITVYQQT